MSFINLSIKKLQNQPFEQPYLSLDMSHFQTQAFRGR